MFTCGYLPGTKGSCLHMVSYLDHRFHVCIWFPNLATGFLFTYGFLPGPQGSFFHVISYLDHRMPVFMWFPTWTTGCLFSCVFLPGPQGSCLHVLSYLNHRVPFCMWFPTWTTGFLFACGFLPGPQGSCLHTVSGFDPSWQRISSGSMATIIISQWLNIMFINKMIYKFFKCYKVCKLWRKNRLEFVKIKVNNLLESFKMYKSSTTKVSYWVKTEALRHYTVKPILKTCLGSLKIG